MRVRTDHVFPFLEGLCDFSEGSGALRLLAHTLTCLAVPDMGLAQ